MKLSEVPDSAPAASGDAPKRMKLSEVWDQAKGSPAPAGDAPPSRLGALWEGLKKGISQVSVPSLPGLLPGVDAKAQRVAGATEAMANQPWSPQMRQFPFTAGAGQIAGSMAATGPLMAAGGATPLARAGMGALTGGAMGAAQPGSLQDRAIGGALGGATGGVVGGVGAKIGPPLTAAANDAISKFPFIAGLLRGTVARTPENFNRAAANTALSPLGVVIPPGKTGHKLIEAMEDAYDDAYNRVLPNVTIPSQSYSTRLDLGQKLKDIKDNTETSEDHLRQLRTFLKGHLEKYFDSGDPIDGKVIKQIQSDLSKEAFAWIEAGSKGSNLNDQRYGQALYRARHAFMDAVEKENPQWADDLRKINQSYANFLPIRSAAAKTNVREAGQFTPDHLYQASRQIAGVPEFARGGNTMQALAEAAAGPMSAQKVNRLLTEVLGLGAGIATGHPLTGAAIGGLAVPKAAQGIMRATENPAARGLGAAVSAAAPAAGVEAANQRKPVKDLIGAITSPSLP